MFGQGMVEFLCPLVICVYEFLFSIHRLYNLSWGSCPRVRIAIQIGRFFREVFLSRAENSMRVNRLYWDRQEQMADTSFADVDLEVVLLRLTRHAQALFGASRVLGFDPADVSYPGGEGPEDLAMNLVVRLLDPADHTVEWKDGQSRPNTERVYVLLRKALDRDFLDLKKSKRYKTTIQVEDHSADDSAGLSLDQFAVYLETPEGKLLKNERVRVIIEAFSDDPKAGEIVRLQLDPEGYNAFTNQELATLLETSVDDIENRKKRVRNRLLRILRRQEKGTGTYV